MRYKENLQSATISQCVSFERLKISTVHANPLSRDGRNGPAGHANLSKRSPGHQVQRPVRISEYLLITIRTLNLPHQSSSNPLVEDSNSGLSRG